MILPVPSRLLNIRVLLYQTPFELCTAQPATKDNKCKNQPDYVTFENFSKEIATRLPLKTYIT